MKKNVLFLAFIMAAFVMFNACDDKKEGEEKDGKEQTEQKDEPKDEPKEEVKEPMSVEEIAEQRAKLDCEILTLSAQMEAMEEGEEKDKINEQLSTLAEDVNALNAEYAKYEGDQEAIEKHQAIYKEKINECN